MKLGFTGSQVGMSDRQKLAVYRFLKHFTHLDEFHHGDCIGADAQAHDVAEWYNLSIVIHPPIKENKRAFCLGLNIISTCEPKEYLDRNHDIVDACQLLIAAPSGLNEEMRSGTWATVRYARKNNVPVMILDP